MATSSSKKGFSGDDLLRAEPWRPSLFDAPPEETPVAMPEAEPEEVAPREASLPTAEQIEAIQKQAYEEGFEVGREQGAELGHREALEEGRKEMAERLQRLDGLLTALATPFKELDDQVERELLTLVVAMVRQLVRREVHTDPQQIIGVLREALSILPVSARNVRVVLHPEDAGIVGEVYASGDAERNWSIVEDPVVERGGCRVVTDTSQVDATLESRLNNLIAPLIGGLRSADPEE